jgi:MFS family permease
MQRFSDDPSDNTQDEYLRYRDRQDQYGQQSREVHHPRETYQDQHPDRPGRESGQKSKSYSVAAQISCLVALLLANMTTEAARYSLNFMVYPDLAPELGITGTQYGILSGLGFTVVFVLCLIPWGRTSDDYRIGRKTVIIAGLIIQLLFSSLQALAYNFWSLLVIRFGLAVGQAAIAAPSFAIIAHVFDSGSVATAYGVFTCGIYLGTGVASLASLFTYFFGWQVDHHPPGK